jgi:hypothetical protein
MKRAILLALSVIILATIACEGQTPDANVAIPTVENSVFDTQETAYGFFPTPSELEVESFIRTLEGMSEHGDVALFQQQVPWEDFSESPDAESEDFKSLRDMVTLSSQNELEPIFIVDPLNGMNRREFMGLPSELADGNFGTPEIRSAFKNYAVRIAREFQPRYLGLASEINTYMDAHPDDVENYISLYNETYGAIKAESPETQVFVTFQWDDLNNLGMFQEGGAPYKTNWAQIEAFEPNLDIWAISSYLCFFFDEVSEVPSNYYTSLLTRTTKPIAVAEGGCSSVSLEIQSGSPRHQIEYLHTVNEQLGGARLDFWIYLIYNDLNMEAFAPQMEADGSGDNVAGLTYFASIGLVEIDGSPKPALAVWDEIRNK